MGDEIKDMVKNNRLPFASILKGVMAERELKLRNVADMAGVRVSVVESWLAGANPHNLVAVGKLARALGLTMRSLLLGEDEQGQGIGSIHELFEEIHFGNGLYRLDIRKLVPRARGSKE